MFRRLTEIQRSGWGGGGVIPKRCSRRCRDGAQVSRITLPSACDVRAWSRDNRNGLETHDGG